MELNQRKLEILHNAFMLSHSGRGQVVQPEALRDAHELCEQGWLERRIHDDQVTWWWSAKAETALALDAMTDTSNRQN
jgi:hypothetical protein